MKKTMLALLLVAVLLTLTACGGGKLTVGRNAEVKVVKAYCAKNLISNHTSYYASSGNTYVVVEIDLTNISGRDDDAASLLEARLMVSGSSLGRFGTLAALTNSEDLNPRLIINAGETRRVYCLFQVEENKAHGKTEITFTANGQTVKTKVNPK